MWIARTFRSKFADMQFGQVHHLEYYVADLKATRSFWDWFLQEMGYVQYQEWPEGVSFRHSTGTYIVFVQLDSVKAAIRNDRQGSGLNHIALQGGSEKDLHNLATEIKKRGGRALIEREDYFCFEDMNQFAVEIYSA